VAVQAPKRTQKAARKTSTKTCVLLTDKIVLRNGFAMFMAFSRATRPLREAHPNVTGVRGHARREHMRSRPARRKQEAHFRKS
jgi:hypothetical protein